MLDLSTLKPLVDNKIKVTCNLKFVLERIGNQSVENAGVAFVKEADERNEFFEKVNNR